jgi:chemotaxis protein MotB
VVAVRAQEGRLHKTALREANREPSAQRVPDPREEDAPPAAVEALAVRLGREFAPAGLAVELDGSRVGIVFDARLLFARGEADLSAPGEQLLRRVAQRLAGAGADRTLEVRSHTDGGAIKPALKDLYPTGWELSAAQAINIVRFLEQDRRVAGWRLVATGLGSANPPSALAQDRGRAHRPNARVEIWLDPPRGGRAAAGGAVVP